MKCSIIIPVGPGHEDLFRECIASVINAINYSTGPFSRISYQCVDDTKAINGRSASRNLGVSKAMADGVDWLFFLDADDLMLSNVFTKVTQAVLNFDAIWGTIMALNTGDSQPTLRANQEIPIRSIDDVLATDPFYSLQMGHFVKTDVAVATPFRTDLNTGEDFDYYLRVWGQL